MKDTLQDNSQIPSGGSDGFADITPYLDEVPSSVHTVEGSSMNSDLVIELGDCRILMNGAWEEESLIRVIRSIRNA